ncbi:class II fructose-bisphosphate aldolase [Harryflintia acetispora]|uniref:class II fructose-bisphosphate aldolase n=1 Tax=Harryflintia acetispora TaxID=1849041 RepID=UPI00189C3394|nr:class II fructose-bisphosphate aldolase [Harryflintia acetispora]
MKLVTLSEILEGTRAGHYAVPHMNVFDLSMLHGVLAAAEEARSPLIVAYGEGFSPVMKLEEFPGMVRSVAGRYHIPVCIHLDHAFELSLIERAVKSGYTSVMLDVSNLPLEENIAQTKRAVGLCRPKGISVESELGHVSVGAVQNDGAAYTDPQEAGEFLARTGVDALAVSIGTAHGVYTAVPNLRLDVLERIAAATDKPLVLHGGSGLTDGQFHACVQRGICKVNIHTDLAQAAIGRVRQRAAGLNYLELCAEVQRAVHDEAMHKIALFGSQNKA